MEGLGVAASVIAVVDISFKVFKTCRNYAHQVKHAESDISRLITVVENLNLVAQSARDLLDSPYGEQLKISDNLPSALKDSKTLLTDLDKLLSTKVNGEKKKSIKAWIWPFECNVQGFSARKWPFKRKDQGFGALEWPFRRQEVDELISNFQQYYDAIETALSIIQTGVILRIDERAALDQLPVAEGASFDSHADEHNPICLQGTRAEVLGDISRWISDPTAKSIFWLNGMAGTGKSTISRTIARQRFKAGNLGASFFFKKGESDRVTLAKFVPTLARQLASSVPHVAGHIKKAIDSDSNIIHRNIEQQFKKLILGPLSEINKSNGKPSTLVIVLDALDECERDQDIELLIELLSKFQGSTSLNLRIFVTSRPEVPIRLGFGAIEGTYQNLVLHEIAASTVRHDIACFLRHELEKTRTKFNRGRPGQPIASNWPKESDLDKLVTIAEPLFISAATICRFVSDHKRGNPQRQLNNFLRQSRQSHGSQLGKIYGPILNQQLDEEMSVDELQQILREFRLIVGAIITIYDPLSALNLAKLLNIPSDVVDDRLDMLQSIFSVPSNREMPIRFLHLSIRDYLVDPQGKGVNEFWIDQSRVHANLTKQCLRIMQHREHGLRKDKCQLRKPWITHKEVDPKRIEKFIPNELRYACRYWVDHAILNTLSACDAEKISDFLRLHFMHWLEVCLWIQVPGAEYPEAALLVLRDCDQSGESSNLERFLLHAIDFLKRNRRGSAGDKPLSVYTKLGFSPTNSFMRSTFAADIPDWFSCHTSGDSEWKIWHRFQREYSESVDDESDDDESDDEESDDEHDLRIISTVFSPDSKTVASASIDGKVRFWCVETGRCKQTLEVYSEPEKMFDISICFSHDSKTMAIILQDQAAPVQIWSVETGECHQVPCEGLGEGRKFVAFSHDSKTVFMASDPGIVRTWNLGTDEFRDVQLEGMSQEMEAITFPPDLKSVSTGSEDGVVQVWSIETGKCQQSVSLEPHHEGESFWGHMAISHDSRSVAFYTRHPHLEIGFWSIKTGKCRQAIEVDTRAPPHFGVGDATLVTSFGVFPLMDGSSSSPPPKPPHSYLSPASGLCVNEIRGIVSWQGSELLLLPNECSLSEAAVSGSYVGFGCDTGRMVFLRFDTVLMEEMSRPEE